MTIQAAYDAWSRTYDADRNLTRDLDHEAVREVLGDRRFASILELGCGTGKNTGLLASLGARVHALDFSWGMLARARAKAPRENVAFTVADLTRPWPRADRSVDLVSADLVLEHVRDLAFVFAEAARCLVPGGTFFVCELHPCRQYLGTQARFERDATTHLIPAFVHHLSDFTAAAGAHGLELERLQEWWHAEDQGKPPRLVSFLFLR